MTASRMAFGSILGTVTSAASAVTTTLDSVTAGVGMLNSFVAKAANEQRHRHIADEEVFLDRLIKEKAEESTLADISTKKFMAKSADHAKFYEEHFEKFTKLLKPNAE